MSTTERAPVGGERLLLRPVEAAEMLGISRSLIYELAAAGEIGTVRMGSALRIPRGEVEAYVARLLQEAAAR